MSIDPEILLGLQNSSQNQSSISLQKQILNMQKLQVLNQVRISKGLLPLEELPVAPPRTSEENWEYYSRVILIILGVGYVCFMAWMLLFK